MRKKLKPFFKTHDLFSRPATFSTSNPGPFGIEAAREKALVKSGHMTPQILDIFVTWPCNCYAMKGGESY